MFLSETAVRNAKPKSKLYRLKDGDGLFLQVHPSKAKYWRLRYFFYGKENVLALGTYPEVSLAEAREKRLQARKLLASGIDPNAKKREDKQRVMLDAKNSLRAVAADWHKTNKSKWTADHAHRLWRRLELHGFPELGDRPITSIRTPELIPLLRNLEKKGSPETAGRLAQVLNVIFRYAVHSGIIEQNPAADLRGVVAPVQKKHFAAIHPSELPELLEKLEIVETSPINKLATRLLLLTFLRPGELRNGLWSDIDWDNRLWNIPPERMKKRRAHIVPLSKQAMKLLKELHKISGYGRYMFPSQQRRKHPVMSENTINMVLKKMGYKDRQVAHGFRAIASTVLNESALFRPDVIEAQLAHIEENNSRKPYNRGEYLQERITMMQWWGDYIEKASKKVTSDVSKIKKIA
ncbi:MAG: integrase arm-type DNA-binding domain-containing protein [Alphaproteobacteria bacterium]|nr:integrase arm-type DNA-binding domain-containing protein [Alphaproteobacteria bacterium]